MYQEEHRVPRMYQEEHRVPRMYQEERDVPGRTRGPEDEYLDEHGVPVVILGMEVLCKHGGQWDPG